ncbi:MAG: T9SS type A sorting domain-containing protein [Nonlabens sp.]
MKTRYLKWPLYLIFIAVSSSVFAQESINSGAIEVEDAVQDVVISASIGQVFYRQNSSTDIIAIEGVQQPLRFEVLSIEAPGVEDNKITLYPNPATTHFKLRFAVWNDEYNYVLMNAKGQQLKSGKILSNEASMEVHNLSAGLYMISIYNTTGFNQTIKFLKK